MKKELSIDIKGYKIFDFHRHLSPMNQFKDNIDQFNIDKFCLMPTMLNNDFKNIMSYIQNAKPYHEKYKEKAIIFGALDFSKDGEYNKELLEKQAKFAPIKGIKIHPEQGFKLEKNFLKRYFKCITDVLGNDVPIYVHTDWPLLEEKGFTPNGIKNTFDKIVSFFPEFKFVMGHAGGSADYLNVWKSCKKFSNVYIETSMAPVTSPLSEVVWKVEPERLVFGSNYPYCGTSIEIVKILSLYKVKEEEKKNILESNAEVLFSW
ncbi:MAG: amidohydrolase family protein [Promethearchaeota archaeon]